MLILEFSPFTFPSPLLLTRFPNLSQHQNHLPKKFIKSVASYTVGKSEKLFIRHMLTKAKIEAAIRGTPDERKYLCSKSFALFVLVYFSEFFTYKIPAFHQDFYDDCERMALGELDSVAWIAFRESGKTSIAKMFLTWNICYQTKRYINWVSYDRKSGEMSLFDVITWLQTNEKLIADFGHFYTEKQDDSVKKLKRISSFITTNKIKVEVFSTGMPTRGRIYLQYRPDLFILDDVENSETVRSSVVTQGIISHIDEMRAGLSPSACVLYLGNYLSESGVVKYIMDLCNRSPRGCHPKYPRCPERKDNVGR